MKHTIYALVENKPGVLARIAGLFSARGFNIDSLAVGETHDPAMSRLTMVVNAQDERILEQIKKQLNKLIDVVSVTDLTKTEYFERELVLIKVSAAGLTRKKLQAVLKPQAAVILRCAEQSAIIQCVGDYQSISTLIESLKCGEIKELVRTGRIAIAAK